ncbi:MAG: hypothetical protein ACTS41_01115 [Candidatus Hodgkinia cicadicola]
MPNAITSEVLRTKGRSEVKRGLVVKVSLKVRLERIKRDIEVQYALKRDNRG